jgi:heterodisulfide reductase subunit C
MDYTPRQLFALLHAGYDNEVLASNTAWHCVSCYNCTVRCPQHIPITEIMYTLKHLAAQGGFTRITDVSDFSSIYVSLVERFGRSFDMGLIFRCYLTHNPMSKIIWGSLALKMGRTERVVTGPSRIRDIDQLQRIIAKAKSMGDEL